MFPRSASAAVCAFALVASVLLAPSSCSASSVATVSVNTEQLGAQIPPDFLGFSDEVGLPTPATKVKWRLQPPAGIPANAEAVPVLGLPGAPNMGFYTMMRNLGPGLLRMGGGSQQRACWDPAAAPHPDLCQGAITPEMLKLYATAAATAGWKMTMGLNLIQKSPTWALSEVDQGVAKQIPADRIVGLELGNEPSGRSGFKGYVETALSYIHVFQTDPIAGKYGLVGPALCCSWMNPENLDFILKGIGPDLTLVTVHHYTADQCHSCNPTITDLLSPQSMQDFNELSRKLVEMTRRYHLPIALAETNSVSGGGKAGVSDVFASTVWGLNYMFNIANDGYDHINFHIAYATHYNAVQTFGWQAGGEEHYLNVAQPLYYAMYMFAKSASGEHFLPDTIQTESNITSFATTACPTCAVHVFVINMDQKASGSVDVHLSGKSRIASMLMLKAPNLNSLAADVRYGGQQFDTDGHIATPQTTKIKPSHGNFRLMLPNASAALLTIPR